MADAAPPKDPAKNPRRFFWPGGLSARLLMVTVLIVVAANLLILPPNLAAFEEQWLIDRLRAAEVATLVKQSAPNGQVTAGVSQELLASAEVVQVSVGIDNERHLILQMPRVNRAPYLVDLRGDSPLSLDGAVRDPVRRRGQDGAGDGQAALPARRFRRDRRAGRAAEAGAAGASSSA